MMLLDTDHTTFLKYPESERGRRMIDRLDAASASEFIGVAIVTVEERMRGWLAVIAREKSALRQVVGYRELALLFEFYKRSKSCHSMRPRPGDLMISADRNFGSAQGISKSRRPRWSTTRSSCPPT
jgi:hypothetical protein